MYEAGIGVMMKCDLVQEGFIDKTDDNSLWAISARKGNVVEKIQLSKSNI
jgi:hypothetical protein